jgi:hypothetical protein
MSQSQLPPSSPASADGSQNYITSRTHRIALELHEKCCREYINGSYDLDSVALQVLIDWGNPEDRLEEDDDTTDYGDYKNFIQEALIFENNERKELINNQIKRADIAIKGLEAEEQTNRGTEKGLKISSKLKIIREQKDIMVSGLRPGISSEEQKELAERFQTLETKLLEFIEDPEIEKILRIFEEKRKALNKDDPELNVRMGELQKQLYKTIREVANKNRSKNAEKDKNKNNEDDDE